MTDRKFNPGLDYVCIAIVILFSCVWFMSSYPYPSGFLNDPDGAYQLAGAQQILHGEHPFTYFRESYGPLTFYASALGQYLSGNRILGEIALLVIGYAAAYVLFYKLLRRARFNPVEALIGTGIALLLIPKLYKYYIVLFPLLGLWTLWNYIRHDTATNLLKLSAAITITGLFRPDFGVYLFLAAFLTVGVSFQHGIKKRIQEILRLVFFVFAFALPWLLWLSFKGGLLSYLYDSSVGSMQTAVDMSLPMPPWETAAGMFGTANLKAFFFRASLLVPAVMIALLIIVRKRLDRTYWLEGIAVALFAQLCLLQALHRSDWGHWLQSLPVLLVGGLWALKLVHHLSPSLTTRVTSSLIAALALVQLVIINNAGRWPDMDPGDIYKKIAAYTPSNDAIVNAVVEQEPAHFIAHTVLFIKENSTPAQRVIALPALPNINYLSARSFGGGQMAILPGYFAESDDQRRFAETALAEDVQIVVLLPNAPFDNNPERLIEKFAPVTMRYVLDHFYPTDKIGPYIIYTKPAL